MKFKYSPILQILLRAILHYFDLVTDLLLIQEVYKRANKLNIGETRKF